MPKNARFADTVHFLRTVRQPSGAPLTYSNSVAELLDSFRGAIPPAVDEAMSMGRVGTEQTRQYRRAMILTLCVLNNTSTSKARAAVNTIPDARLHASLEQMLRDAAVIYGGRTLGPVADRLKADPAGFLAHTRIKLGSGSMKTSGQAAFDLSWDPHANLYLIEPHNAIHDYVHASVIGFNVHVQKYRDVRNNLNAIVGAAVTEDLALTTQLSGCCVIYRVNGANLTVAHVMPDAEVRQGLPAELQPHAGDPVGVVLTHRMARDGDLAGGAGGTLGIFGMVNTVPETGQRMLGGGRVRANGYAATLGNAYFIGVKSGGNWQLFGQQNNPGNKDGGVSNLMRLYP
jgi:hypothetical protein